MREGPDIARVAALVADTARSAMLIALMDGRASTAVSIFRLDAGMDSGPILAQPELEIAPEDDFAFPADGGQ